MKITGKLEIDTHGDGAYEATVDDEYESVQAAVDELVRRLNETLAANGA